jgi:hypothetical protein
VNLSNTFYVNSSFGWAGINRPNPSSAFDVGGTLTVEGINVTGRQISDNTTQGNKITTLEADNTTQANAIATLQSDNTTQAALLGQKLNLTGGTLSGLLSINNISATNNLSINVSGVLYVNSSIGRVGIWTTNPLSTFEVVGTANITGGLNVSAGGLVVYGGLFNATGGISCGMLSGGTDTDFCADGGATSGWTITSTTVYNNTVGVNVGIGTATPDHKLTLVGGTFLQNLNGTQSVLGGLEVGAAVSGPAGVFVSGKYAYVVASNNSGNEFRILDVGNFSNSTTLSIVEVGGLDIPETDAVTSVYVAGKYAYIRDSLRRRPA